MTSDDEPRYSDDAEVAGYGKPSKSGRIQPGEVRNPGGRPIGSKNRPRDVSDDDLRRIVIAEAARPVNVNDTNGPVTISTARAVVRSANIAAIKGNTRAQKLSTEILFKAQADRKLESEREIATAIEYKNAFEKEMGVRKRLGVTGPELLPHGDHIEIDLARGCVHIRGPATKHEQASWRRWEQERDALFDYLHWQQDESESSDDFDPERSQREIGRTKASLEIIGYALDGDRDAMALMENCYRNLMRTNPEFRDLIQSIEARSAAESKSP